jgi:hypothetical protein
VEFSWTFPRPTKGSVLKYGLLLLILFGLVRCCWPESKAAWDGCPAPDEPIQTKQDLPPAFEHDGFRITPLANYSITGVVVSRERYYFDQMAGLIPIEDRKSVV